MIIVHVPSTGVAVFAAEGAQALAGLAHPHVWEELFLGDWR